MNETVCNSKDGKVIDETLILGTSDDPEDQKNPGAGRGKKEEDCGINKPWITGKVTRGLGQLG